MQGTWTVHSAALRIPFAGGAGSERRGRAFPRRRWGSSLNDRGWIERREDPRDRRAYRVHLTRAGQAVTRRVIPLANALNAEAASCLSASEREALLDLLERLKANLQ